MYLSVLQTEENAKTKFHSNERSAPLSTKARGERVLELMEKRFPSPLLLPRTPTLPR